MCYHCYLVMFGLLSRHLYQKELLTQNETYPKNCKNWDTWNNFHNCPTIGTVGFYIAVLCSKDADRITNREDPDQTAPWGAVWSGSALFAQTYLSQYLKLLRYSVRFLRLLVFASFPSVFGAGWEIWLCQFLSLLFLLFIFLLQFVWSFVVSIGFFNNNKV